MNFFNIIKSEHRRGVFPENDIEHNLHNIYNGKTEKWNFFSALSRTDLIVITSKNIDDNSEQLEKDDEIELMTLNDDSIAVFTSENRIFDNGIVRKNLPYIRISGKDLFVLTRGMNVILNPFSDIKKLICANEIAQLAV